MEPRVESRTIKKEDGSTIEASFIMPSSPNPATRPVVRDVVGTVIKVGQVVAWPTRRSSSMEMSIGTVDAIILDRGKTSVRVWLWLVGGRLVGRYSRLTAGVDRLVVCSVTDAELSEHIAAGLLGQGELS